MQNKDVFARLYNLGARQVDREPEKYRVLVSNSATAKDNFAKVVREAFPGCFVYQTVGSPWMTVVLAQGDC